MSRPPTEDELVERARGGDGAAFGLLARDHQELAFRTAYLITRNAADAEDAAQTALVEGVPRAAALPPRRAPASLAARDRRERGAQPRPRRRAPRRADPACRCTSSLGGRGSVPRGEPSPPRSARESARGARRARRRRPNRALVPLPARPERGGDGRGSLRPARDGQVADVARARPAAKAAGGARMSELELRLGLAGRRDRLPADTRSRDRGRALAGAPPARAGCGRSRSPSRSRSRCRRRARVLAGRPQRLPRAVPAAGRDGRRGSSPCRRSS